jgi:hypothetical protein
VDEEAIARAGLQSQNKIKSTMLRSTMMPQIRKHLLDPNVNTKSTLEYRFGFCFNVSFIGTIFSRNWCLLFLLVNFQFNVCVLTTLFTTDKLVSVHRDISKIFFLFHE